MNFITIWFDYQTYWVATGEYIYTGMYDTTQSNPIITRNSNDVDPYLKPTVRSKIDGRNVVMLLVDLRQ